VPRQAPQDLAALSGSGLSYRGRPLQTRSTGHALTINSNRRLGSDLLPSLASSSTSSAIRKQLQKSNSKGDLQHQSVPVGGVGTPSRFAPPMSSSNSYGRSRMAGISPAGSSSLKSRALADSSPAGLTTPLQPVAEVDDYARQSTLSLQAPAAAPTAGAGGQAGGGSAQAGGPGPVSEAVEESPFSARASVEESPFATEGAVAIEMQPTESPASARGEGYLMAASTGPMGAHLHTKVRRPAADCSAIILGRGAVGPQICPPQVLKSSSLHLGRRMYNA
jgi:hypothetical protein